MHTHSVIEAREVVSQSRYVVQNELHYINALKGVWTFASELGPRRDHDALL
jgi:hypothetical protein